ncbi:MAG: hypothetical protein K9L88_08005 [Chromatiaceae bacterium]|nr:hypothetical protein [Chromatiaceae bacterium]
MSGPTPKRDDLDDLLNREPPCRHCLHDLVQACALQRHGWPGIGRLCAAYDEIPIALKAALTDSP